MATMAFASRPIPPLPPPPLPPIPQLPPGCVESKLRNYVLQPHQRKFLGYPIESDHHPGKALIYPSFPSSEPFQRYSESSSSDDADEEPPSQQKCDRCYRPFRILRNEYLNKERCIFHWGKLQNQLGYVTYTCCNRLKGSDGCSSANGHVWSGLICGVNGPLDGYVFTTGKGYGGAYAIDCEMCYTMRGLELCKVSIVDMNCKTVYVTYVKPSSPIVDYNTRFSGITFKDLNKKNGVKTLKQVQSDILKFVSAETILIGHALENDLRALKIVHETVIDTAVTFVHPMGLPYRSSLRYLVTSKLNKIIQTASHDSTEDALSCVQLMLHKLNCDFNGFPRSL